MNRFLAQMSLYIGLSLVNTAAFADLRVLFRFDESGHHVHTLTKAPARKLLRKQSGSDDADGARSVQSMALSTNQRLEAARAQLSNSTAILLWFDTNGNWLANSSESDPRVTHAPAHIEGFSKSQAGLIEGAWLATAPDASASVTILFPAVLALGLGSQEWHVILPTE